MLTPVAILSYPWLGDPQPPFVDANGKSNGKPMHSAALVFVPEIMARYPQYGTSFAPLKAAIEASAKETFGDKLPSLLRNPNFKQGFRTDGEDKGYPADSIYINARNERRPGLVYLWADTDGKPAMVIPQLATIGYTITDADLDKIKAVFYPGALVRASVRAFSFNHPVNKGVSFALNNLQLIDGTAPRMDSQKAAKDDFSADASAAPASLEDAGAE